MRLTLELRPDWVVVTLDLRNAHNDFDRAKAMERLRKVILEEGRVRQENGPRDGEQWKSAAQSIVKAFHCLNFPVSEIFSFAADGTLENICEGDEGGPQGSPLTPVAFAMLIDPVIKKYDVPGEVIVRAISDDITVCCPRGSKLIETLNGIKADMEALCGLQLTPSKCAYYCPPGQRMTEQDKPEWLRPGKDEHGNPGVSIVGAPIGNAAFTRAWISRETTKICQQIEQTAWLIGKEDSHAGHMVLKMSLQRRYNYIMATNLPQFTREGAKKVDESLQKAMMSVYGVNLWDTSQTSREGQSEPSFVATRAALPCKYGGTGVERTTSIVDSAFVNSVTHCISRFFTIPVASSGVAGAATGSGQADRDAQVGLFDHLRPLFGMSPSDQMAFKGDENQQAAMEHWFQGMEGSSSAHRQNMTCTIGESYQTSWNSLLEAGKKVGAEKLTNSDINALSCHRAPPTPTTESSSAEMNANPLNWSQNPFTWTAKQVIVNARRIKLQWLTRQVRSVAAWRGLQTRVNQLAAVHRGARREEVDQSDPARRTRAEVSKAALRDRRFLAFMHSGKYSRAPLVATCRDVPMRSDEFREFIPHYFGLESPVCRPIAGKRVRRGTNASFHVAVDPEGVNLLTAANGPGGKRTLLHNRIQDLLIYEASQAGIQASAGRVIDTRAALHASNWQGTASPTPEEPPGEEEEEGRGRKTRILPDIVIDFGSRQEIPFLPADKPPIGSKMLFDVKTLGLRDSYYNRTGMVHTRQSQDGVSSAVQKRANEVHGEYTSKATERDRQFLAIQQNQPLGNAVSAAGVGGGGAGGGQQSSPQVGPFERALRTYGRVKGLALGAFGDLSEEWDVLLGFIARKWAVKQRRQSGYRQPVGQLASTIREKLSIRLGSLVMRQLVRIKLDLATETAPFEHAVRKSRFLQNRERDMQRMVEYHHLPRFGHGLVDSVT